MTHDDEPECIGPYAIERRLGAGGMGAVYLGYSVDADPVAIKVIRPDRTDPHTRARFEREAEIARTISGTGRVARFLDADPLAEQPWLAMDYVPGRSLAEVVATQGVLAVPLVASLGELLAEGLSAVHNAGLVHRDLKASNVMLGAFGPVIIDFGLGAFLEASKGSMSQPGTFLGSVPYMPPEQARGETDVTGAADVYGLGTVLLHAAAGHTPYGGGPWQSIVLRITNPDINPDLSGLPEELKPLVASMLAFTPGDRPTLEQVTRQCTDLLDRLGISPTEARLSLILLAESEDRRLSGMTPQPDAEMLERLEALDKQLRVQQLGDEVEADAAAGEDVSPVLGDHDVEPDMPIQATPSPRHASAADTRPPNAKPGRPPASRRVAEELRKRYAMSGQLTWSERSSRT
ncbi:serine/threonine-protein kinase [Streptacidiphilus sp. MAP5-3]|uniref:serine/threonine-protein kinase n=1 Tax=unclassified Streptacidiphilus TaxID=2643834 RepID=UPI003511EE23